MEEIKQKGRTKKAKKREPLPHEWWDHAPKKHPVTGFICPKWDKAVKQCK
ncbi:hypothetical protein C7967_11516 [Thalassospira sp. 11-3]|nr:hypothetical protein C7967_11516 [Thalassospira sp. 11-3]